MKAIIPAAGHGTRFLPVTRVVPKEMLPIGSRPALEVIVDEGYIFNVAVSEDYRRRGVGYALVRELVTCGMKNSLCFITLEVRESNSAAIALYSKFGFIRVGERKNYYSDPSENAVLMTKYF